MEEDLIHFINEVGMLKRIKRTGYAIHGSSEADTVAEHSYRAMLIGFLIAKNEKADENKVLRMLLFHDIPETRLGDMHKITQNYIDKKNAEEQIAAQQATLLPQDIGKEFLSLIEEFNAAKTREALCAKDADKLELAFQAKEFVNAGSKDLMDIVERVGKVLKTKTAQEIYKNLMANKKRWWEGLKKPAEDSY